MACHLKLPVSVAEEKREQVSGGEFGKKSRLAYENHALMGGDFPSFYFFSTDRVFFGTPFFSTLSRLVYIVSFFLLLSTFWGVKFT